MQESEPTANIQKDDEGFAKPTLKYGLRVPKKTDIDEEVEKLVEQKNPEIETSTSNEVTNVNNSIQIVHQVCDESLIISLDNANPPFVPVYQAPFWDAKPLHQYKLEVLKNGGIVDILDIFDKGHYLIGRIPLCDISLEHQSVSRQHAVIQHRETGEVYLYDLGSTHGTFVNKKKVQPKTYQPLKPSAEELEKQEEEIRQKQKEAREKLVAAKLEKEQTVRQRQDIMLKAWQADVMVEDDEPIPAPKERPRDQWDFDDEETDPNKPFWYDPTEGGLFEVEESVEYQGKRAFRVEDDEEDDFFDRTKKLQNKAKPAKQVETAESLEAKKAVLIQKKDEVLQQMANFEKQELLKKESASRATDSLDAFMGGIAVNLEHDVIKKLRSQIAEIDKETSRLDRLIKISKPALAGLKKRPATLPPPVPRPTKKQETDESNTTQPNTESTSKTMERVTPPPAANDSTKGLGLGTEDKKKVPFEGEAPSSLPAFTVAKVPTNAKLIIPEGTKNTPPQQSTFKPPPSKKEEPKKPKAQSKKQKEQPEEQQQFEEDAVDWLPPTDQAGDGKTKLNKLFGY